MRWYFLESEKMDGKREIYDCKCPPNSSVSETWTTRGLESDGARIIFVEYDFYDKDPDGVREAFDCTYDSVHTLTADITAADPEKLFMYTVESDGKAVFGFNADIKNAQATYVFTEKQDFSEKSLLYVTEKAKELSSSATTLDDINNVKRFIRKELLGGRTDTVCLFMLK